MKKGFLYPIIALLLICLSSCIFAAEQYDKYLTVTDVEKISGLKGVKIVPWDPEKGAGGDLNFANAKGDLVLMVRFQEAKYYQKSKALTKYCKSTVSGVGNEAFKGPADGPEYILVFRKGTFCVSLNTYFDTSGKTPTMLKMEQLISLGKLIVSRL